MKISLIIPCYFVNEDIEEMTAMCLDSISNTTDDQPEEIIIVNDGSPYYVRFIDDTDFVQQFKTIEREKNGGYAAAVNTGLFHATGDILILGNNDLVFPEGWLPKLLKVLEEYDVATCWTSDQKGITVSDHIEERAKFGALFAMKREVYETVGPFDEQFRGYFSDTDYRHRVLDEGFTIGKTYDLVVHHHAKATYTLTDPFDDEFLRSQRLYERKYGVAE